MAAQFAERELIFNQENGLGAVQGLVQFRSLLLGVERLFHLGKIDFEGSSGPRLAVDFDVATALLDHAVHRGQPKAGALALPLGSKEWLEGSRARRRLHADAVVSHSEENVVSDEHRVGIAANELVIHVEVAGRDLELASVGHGIARIHGQIHDDLFNLTLVGLDASQAGVEIGAKLDVFADQAFQHLLHVLDHGIQVQYAGIHDLLPAEGQQLAGERRSTMSGLQHLVHTTTQGAVGGGTLLNNFSVTDDDSEEIVEVVSHAPGKPTYRFHLLRLAKLFFQPFALGHVAIHDDQFLDLPRSYNRAGSGLNGAPGPIFVAHAVLQAGARARSSRFRGCLGYLVAIFRVNLVERGSVYQIFACVTQNLFVRRTVVEPLPIRIDHGNHVGRVFRNQAEQFLALHQLLSNGLNLEVLVEGIDVE